MKDETKVGLFILVGLMTLATAIFLLGDFSLEKHYDIYVSFNDVAGLAEKSNIRLNGVEVGKVKKIYIDKDRVIVKLAVRKDVIIYKNSKFLIGSTSVIGSKFLQIDQGDPSSGIIKEGEILYGENVISMDRAITNAISNLENFLKGLNNKGDFTKNLNDIVYNLRDITANLNEIISVSQPKIESSINRVDSVMGKLDKILEKIDLIASKIEKEDGPIGALISDKESKENLKQTINNIKDTSASLKEVIGKTSKLKTYWMWDTRYETHSGYNANSVGLRIYTRENKYYYAGLSNFFNIKNKDELNYEIKNTVDAYMGWEWNKADFYIGALRGAAGAGVRWRPFYYDPIWGRFSLLAEGNEFHRNRRIRGRYFNDPRIDAGIEFKVNKYLETGMRITDLLEVKRFNCSAKILFEDKDISYLFGVLGGGGYLK